MPTRQVTAFVVATAVLAGCSTDGTPVDDGGRTAVGDLAIAVPHGWERIDEDVADPLVTNTRFVDPDRRLRLLQVVVGCGDGGVDSLVASVGQPRGQLVVVGARERAEPPDVAGLDRARRVTLDLGSGREGEDPDFVLEAIYGERGTALVLVELNAPVAGEPIDADAVLDSVTVDGDALEERCAG